MLTLYVLIVYTIYMHYCSCWLLYSFEWLTTFAPTILYALLQMTNFLWTTAIDITPLLRTFSVGTIPYDNFRLPYHNWKLFMNYQNFEQFIALCQYTSLICTIPNDNQSIKYFDWQLLYALLKFTNLLSIIVMHNIFMHY